MKKSAQPQLEMFSEPLHPPQRATLEDATTHEMIVWLRHAGFTMRRVGSSHLINGSMRTGKQLREMAIAAGWAP